MPLALPGNPARLNAISDALDKRRPDIHSIVTLEPIDRLLPLWQRIFAKLESRGVAVKYVPSLWSASGSDISSATDLRRALAPGFSPSDDGSLIFYHPFGPLDAAEGVAAWLRSLDDIAGTVVINPDVTLDEALRRFGLPVTGAAEGTNDDPFLQILPLVLAMGWDPPDPQRALELLILPDGPIPHGIARALRASLQQWPAVGSPHWEESLSSALDALSSPDFRSATRERLASIFRPDAKVNSPYPASALVLRAQSVRKWAATRRHAIHKPPSPEVASHLDAVIAQCSTFEKLIALSGFSSFTEPQLLKLNAELRSALGSERRYAPEVGIASVNSPGAIVGPARRVIWWDFTLESVPRLLSIPLSRAELAALSSVGVTITPAAELASDLSRRWRRPFAHAYETLLLVCPTFGDDNEERHHHPIWDEVAANIKKGTPSTAPTETPVSGAAATRTRPRSAPAASPAPSTAASIAPLIKPCLAPAKPPRTRVSPVLPIPAARRSWKVHRSLISARSRHSPSSLQALLGCPFKWSLTYLGRLYDPEIAALTDNATMIGKLSHEILAEVLRSAPPDGPAAQATAQALFNTLGPRLAAPLFLPGAPVQISFARQATADAARALVDHLLQAGLPVVAVEHEASKTAGALELFGRLDLLAGDPPVVIDLKWSGASYHHESLKNGTAVQLATYAFMKRPASRSARFPTAGYFIIRNQRLIAPKDAPFSNYDAVECPPLEETWKAFLTAALERLDEIATGRIDALAVPLDDETDVPDKDVLADGRLTLAPPCKFCSFGFLCGLSWENAQ